MKKQKRSTGFDEKPDLSRDIDIGVDNQDDDDDVIELEDIIEMPARAIDEDEDLDLDVEILDAESGLDFDMPAKAGGQRTASEPDERDFLEFPRKDEKAALGLFDDEAEESEDLFETMKAAESGRKPVAEEAAFEDGEEDLLESLLEEKGKAAAEPKSPSEGHKELRERAAAALKIAEEEMVAPPREEPASPEPVPEVSVPAPAPAQAAPAMPLDDSLVAECMEELVSRMEARLIEHIRQVVESRLPEIVQNVIREEIDRLKEEME